MDGTQDYVFYDAVSERGHECWLPNPWKSRMVLNYKKLPYRTEWLKFNEVGEKVRELGVAANTGRGKPYTIPVIRTPSGEHVMDSDVIATKIEALCPTPSLALDDSTRGETAQAVNEVLLALYPLLISVSRDMMAEDGRKWYEAEKSQSLGMSCDEFAKSYGGETAWKNAEPGLAKLKALLTSHKKTDGPFIRGKDVTYGDFLIVSLLEWTKRSGDGEVFQRIVQAEQTISDLYEACRPWLSRSN